jgi:hypothetical protein
MEIEDKVTKVPNVLQEAFGLQGDLVYRGDDCPQVLTDDIDFSDAISEFKELSLPYPKTGSSSVEIAVIRKLDDKSNAFLNPYLKNHGIPHDQHQVRDENDKEYKQLEFNDDQAVKDTGRWKELPIAKTLRMH